MFLLKQITRWGNRKVDTATEFYFNFVNNQSLSIAIIEFYLNIITHLQIFYACEFHCVYLLCILVKVQIYVNSVNIIHQKNNISTNT